MTNVQQFEEEKFGKATKQSLAQTATREASRLKKGLLFYVLYYVLGLGLTVYTTFRYQKLGWFVLPVFLIIAWFFNKQTNKIEKLEGRASAYKSVKPKTIHRRDRW